ncbi:acyltransferase family protein [Butyrivibrio fibrisolvens]|uniref:acyltransferase family protein n=1 Tax=Butyrivibrio fibrisolvens TaxID=831 RepID=UPI0004099E1A
MVKRLINSATSASINEKELNIRMNYLRGILALLIVLGHCSMNYTKEVPFLLLIHKSNFISVCFFFFLSGWSLSFNYEKIETYLKGFWINKILKLFLLAIICRLVEMFIKAIVLCERISFDSTIVAGWNWYIYELLFFYILFWGVYSLQISSTYKSYLISIIVFLILTILWFALNGDFNSVNKTPIYWSSLSFPFGCLFHSHLPSIFHLHAKRFCFVLLVISVGCCSCLIIRGYYFSEVILHNMLGICIILLVVFLIAHVDVTQINVIKYFTRISGEIYFYQFIVLDVIKSIFISKGLPINYLYCILVLALTISLGGVMHILLRPLQLMLKEIAKCPL